MSDPIKKALKEVKEKNHDLRNDLAAIKGYAELITQRISHHAQSYHWAHGIIEVVNRIIKREE